MASFATRVRRYAWFHIAVRADVIHGDDSRVAEARRRFGFLDEALTSIVIAGNALAHDLDGHVATETRIARAINSAHAAFVELVDDLYGPRRVPGASIIWWRGVYPNAGIGDC